MDGPIRNILVYIDGTEQSVTAAQYAICLSKAIGAHLAAAYIVNTRALSDLVKARIFLQAEQEEYHRDLEADAERYLNHVRELGRQKGVAVETVSAAGTVHQEIRALVLSKKIDLLIVGELSRIRSRRDEFYNEAERAMRNVPCSVLIVKDPELVWQMYETLVK
jgi:nucleotide-binding universal stress UspA family protein